jgi:maintenance of morphology protein 1
VHGLLLGQLSIVLLLAAFIKFFIFGDPPTPDPTRHLSTLSPTHQRAGSLTHSSSSAAGASKPSQQRNDAPASASHILRAPPVLTPAIILAKTYYNVHAHQPESLDWFNVLVAQTMAQLRADAHADNAVLASLTGLLNGAYKPSFLSAIAVTDVSLGEDFPIFSNCRVHPVADDEAGAGRLQARMDVDLADFLTLGIETTMVLNYPRPRTAVLPVALSVSVVRFSGTLAISFLPASVPLSGGGEAEAPGGRTPTTLAFSFLPNYTLGLSTRSLLGSRSRLQDVPKIAQLVESRLRLWFEERCVQPRMQQVVVPSLWPRMKNVVDGDGAVTAGAGMGEAGREGLREERREGGTRQAEAEGAEREGLRWRGGMDRPERSPYEVPGAMPGMLVTT